MDCPKCRANMAREESCHSCANCGGVWFSLSEARSYFVLPKRTRPPDGGSAQPTMWRTDLACPDCRARLMHAVLGDDLVVDRCTACDGVFFDAGESLQLKSAIASGIKGPALESRVRNFVLRQGPYR